MLSNMQSVEQIFLCKSFGKQTQMCIKWQQSDQIEGMQRDDHQVRIKVGKNVSTTVRFIIGNTFLSKELSYIASKHRVFCI